MEIKHHYNGYILAGGKSSRMGEDKGLMLFNGKPVVQYVIEAMKEVTDRIIIVSDNSAYEAFGLEVIKDEIKGIGPAGGIYSALNHTCTEINFIVSCDMPFVTKQAIGNLIEQIGDADILLPVHHGQLEPLFGVYKKRCLKEWKILTGDGMIKLKELVTHFRLEKLAIDDNDFFSKDVFLNINTREEFAWALKQI